MPVSQELLLPFLERITFHTPVFILSEGRFFSSLPFLMFIQCISSPSPIRLTLHLEFNFRFRSPTLVPLDTVWSDLTNVLALPIFRYPIELQVAQKNHTGQSVSPVEAISLLKGISDVAKSLEGGKLIITGDSMA
jgi:hypothetical protein